MSAPVAFSLGSKSHVSKAACKRREGDPNCKKGGKKHVHKRATSRKSPGKSTNNFRPLLPSVKDFPVMEYQVSTQGRVAIQLVRLMGTDRIRVMDPEYMTELLKKLEAEEHAQWLQRKNRRTKLERKRYRQLALDGLMEPGPETKYLYKHPVFRVNRILKRLLKLDSTMSTTATKRLPPITPVEPFEDPDNTGIFFGFHEDHYMKSEASFRSNKKTFTPSASVAASVSDVSPASPKPSGVLIGDEWDGEGHSINQENDGVPTRIDSFAQMKIRYGLWENEDLETPFTQTRSSLIDQLYADDKEEAEILMAFSNEILGVYRREQHVADDFVQKVHRKYFN